MQSELECGELYGGGEGVWDRACCTLVMRSVKVSDELVVEGMSGKLGWGLDLTRTRYSVGK